MGVVVMEGFVSWVVPVCGSYVLVNKADNAIPTIIAANTNTEVSSATRGTRRDGRTHPSMKYHSRAATTTSTATASHHGYPRTLQISVMSHNVAALCSYFAICSSGYRSSGSFCVRSWRMRARI